MRKYSLNLYAASSPEPGMLRLRAGDGVVAAAFLSALTFAVWTLAFLNTKPAWREADDAAEGCMENDMNATL